MRHSVFKLSVVVILFCAAEIGAIIGRDFWCHDYESRDVNKSAVTGRTVEGEALKEEFTDHCIAEILGTTSVFYTPLIQSCSR